MNALIIDIETWPLPEDELAPFMPAAEEFDPAAVRVGNLKDPDKIADKIAAAAETHEAERDRKRREWIERATLDARYSRVFAVGARGPGGSLTDGIRQIEDPDDEAERGLLRFAWNQIEQRIIDRGTVAGWNITGFDLPFLWQRAKILGVPTPDILTPVWRNEWLVELMDRWTLGSGKAKLDDVARALGLAGKVDLGGKLPWQIAQDDPEKAREYLRRDIELTRAVAEKLTADAIRGEVLA